MRCTLHCQSDCGAQQPSLILAKLQSSPSYSGRKEHINLVPTFIRVQNVVQPHKTWVW